MSISDAALNSYVLLAVTATLIIVTAYVKTIAGRLIRPIYRKKHLFFEAEKRFFRTLEYAVRDEKVKVLAKMRLADIFSVGRRDRKHNWRDFSRISQKHVDFLLVDAVSLEPVMGVELDDSSHLSSKGRKRDRFVNRVFKDAGLPLHHIRASGRYDPQIIRQMLFATAQHAPRGERPVNPRGRFRELS